MANMGPSGGPVWPARPFPPNDAQLPISWCHWWHQLKSKTFLENLPHADPFNLWKGLAWDRLSKKRAGLLSLLHVQQTWKQTWFSSSLLYDRIGCLKLLVSVLGFRSERGCSITLQWRNMGLPHCSVPIPLPSDGRVGTDSKQVSPTLSKIALAVIFKMVGETAAERTYSPHSPLLKCYNRDWKGFWQVGQPTCQVMWHYLINMWVAPPTCQNWPARWSQVKIWPPEPQSFSTAGSRTLEHFPVNLLHLCMELNYCIYSNLMYHQI